MRIAFTFARINPPTIGHHKLIDKLKSIPAQERRVFLSPSHDANKNPLSFDTRYDLVKEAFEDLDVVVSHVQLKDVFACMKFINDLGWRGHDVSLVVGGDRVKELSKRLPMYNNQQSDYYFSNIEVVNAGNRSEADTVAGMSSTKLREAAKLNDYVTFENGLPPKLRHMSSDIMLKVREACHYPGLAYS